MDLHDSLALEVLVTTLSNTAACPFSLDLGGPIPQGLSVSPLAHVL